MEQMLAWPYFLEVSQISTILRLFLITCYLYKNVYNLQKLTTLCSEKLARSKYPQKLMSWNSRAEIFENH